MEFLGDFLVRVIDYNNLRLTEVEDAISNFQSIILNQVRTIRNNIDIARRKGLFKQEEPSFKVDGLNAILAKRGKQASTQQPSKRKQATEDDIMDIATSIRNLISRQKGGQESAQSSTSKTKSIKTTKKVVEQAVEKPEVKQTKKKDIDSKIAEYQKSSEDQRSRMDSRTPIKKPVQEEKEKGVKKKKPTKKKTKKLELGEDMLPKGFQDELMKNIKSLMEDKEEDEEEKE